MIRDLEDRVEKVFGISKHLQKKSYCTLKEEKGLLEMEVKIDRSKYKNRLSSYSEILKEYFSHHRIFVLTRIKENKGIAHIIAILFHNSKKSIMSEMKTFTPNYLVKTGKSSLLVSQDDEKMTIYELPFIVDKEFNFKGYRYKVANEIKLR